MENYSKPSMAMTAAIWGAITGMIGIVYTLILYYADLMTNKPASWASYAILIVGIYLGTKAFRDQSLGGYISFGKALGTGVLISLFNAIISVIFMLILFLVIDPELMTKIMAEQQDKMLESGKITEEQMEQGMEMGKKFFIPFAIFGGLVAGVFFGTIISLITSAILKKEGDPFNKDMASVN